MNYRLLYTILVLFLAPFILRAQSSESYDDVMLIVNQQSAESVEIGDYFAERRGIPEDHICRVDAGQFELMDSATCVLLRWRIQEWMRERDLIDSINYIVTTKGCPLRIITAITPDNEDYSNGKYGGQCSFEECLSLMNGADSVHILSYKTGRATSKYAARNLIEPTHFRRDPETMPMYLVTRLDAFTVDQVKAMILRAEHPAAASEGLFVFDVDPSKGSGASGALNAYMQYITPKLTSRGLHVLLNEDQTYVRNQLNVVGYSSFGSNDGNSGGYAGSLPKNTWVDGAIAQMFVSTSAITFANVPGAQTLIAELIAEGASGVIGYTDEPYASSMAQPHILYNRYTSGFNMAESFFASMPYTAWRQVVVGDPKMKLSDGPSGVVETAASAAGGSGILSIAPNPADSRAVIRYRVAGGGEVRLEVFDMLGRPVTTLVDKPLPTGEYSAVVATEELPAGIYICRLTGAGGTQIARAVLHRR
jgi:uncharacterized protein (TIGR03790 family)